METALYQPFNSKRDACDIQQLAWLHSKILIRVLLLANAWFHDDAFCATGTFVERWHATQATQALFPTTILGHRPYRVKSKVLVAPCLKLDVWIGSLTPKKPTVIKKVI